MANQGYIEDDRHLPVTKDGIKAWSEKNIDEAGIIALYCNTPSNEKKQEIYNRCQNCTDSKKAKLLAEFKQECVLTKINGKFFDMGKGKTGGKKKTNRRRRKKTKRRLTVRLHK
jgi:hypothetical protein